MLVGGFKTFHFWKHGDNNKRQKERFQRSKYFPFFSPFHEIGSVLPLREPFPTHPSRAPRGVVPLAISQPNRLVPCSVCFSRKGCFPPFQVGPLPTWLSWKSSWKTRESDFLGPSGVPETGDPGKGGTWPSQRSHLLLTESRSPCVSARAVSQKEISYQSCSRGPYQITKCDSISILN